MQIRHRSAACKPPGPTAWKTAPASQAPRPGATPPARNDWEDASRHMPGDDAASASEQRASLLRLGARSHGCQREAVVVQGKQAALTAAGSELLGLRL
jgi:hypothetical protein